MKHAWIAVALFALLAACSFDPSGLARPGDGAVDTPDAPGDPSVAGDAEHRHAAEGVDDDDLGQESRADLHDEE